MASVFTGSSLLQSIGHANGAMLNTLMRNVITVIFYAVVTYMFGVIGYIWMALTVSEIIGGSMMLAHAVHGLKRESTVHAGFS